MYLKKMQPVSFSCLPLSDAASKQTQKMGKTVEGIISKVKDDAAMSDSDKINTLSLLLQKFVAENGV